MLNIFIMSFSSLTILLVCAVACGAFELNSGNETISTFPSDIENTEEVVYIEEEEEMSDLNFRNLRDGNFPKSSLFTKSRIDSHHRVLVSSASIKKWQDLYNNILFNDDDVVATVDSWVYCSWTLDKCYFDDRFSVKYEKDICYIYAEETNESLDWWNNLQITKARIEDSGYTKTEAYKHWYWKKWGWGWRWTYVTKTRQIRILDEGVNGFVDPFNDAAKQVEAAVKSKCKHATKYQYAGFSRGGGLAQIIALHHFRNGLFEGVHTSLVVFNAPNALVEWSSNDLEDNLDESFNIVRYGEVYVDPVNMFPIGFTKPGHTLFIKCNSARSPLSAHLCGGEEMEGQTIFE